MKFKITLEVEVNRVQGKFASRDEIGELLQEAIQEADPSSLTTGEDAEYETVSWEVTEVEKP